MATDWLGSIVSINCGESLGVYQGRVSAVDQVSQTISLTRPFHNGVKCLVPEVTFRAGDITELKILEIPGPGDSRQCGDSQHMDMATPGVGCQVGPSQNGTSKVLKKPMSSSAPQNIPRRTDMKSQDIVISPQQQCSKSYMDRHMETLSQSKGFRRRHNSWSSSSRHPNQVTPKKSGLKNGQMKSKDDECFGDDIDEIPDTDFDFEGNLALFDKAAVFEEIETYERRSGTRSRGTPSEKPARYRHDENILESEPIVYRRIVVPQNPHKEFCTDSGLVVPSVSYELHKKLLAVAEKHGLTLERRLEMTGVCASQMALSLLGGPNRYSRTRNIGREQDWGGPHNAAGLSFSLGREDSVVDPSRAGLWEFPRKVPGTPRAMSVFLADLPDTPVDLVINCLDCHENAFLRDQPWYKAVVDWANQNRAPVLSIDPPISEMELGIDAKWSLALGLPLPLGERAGRVYLCDIGIPQKVFQEVGINYHSPFGCKFVIPLHST
ncbi:EDC3 protein, partial [Brachypodius atriceps]|nr:EDC3 protein [Brachypodius atriceps]